MAQRATTGGTPASYRRVCELASGGMGTVELAVREEGRFRRLYAIKRLREIYREDDEAREMFLDEARIAGLLRHPNAVSVLDVGEDDGGPFLVMDYIEGASVGKIIARAASERVPLQIGLRIAIDAAEGLHAAHELRDARSRPMGLVHRDVSPQNLLVGFDGVTRVTDFGIAKALGRTTRTATGILKGKYGYLSPEQLRFEEPDRRSDVFSLGVVLFELLSGKRLYKNVDGMDGARRILNEPPPDIGECREDVPDALVELLFSMLAKDPAHRPPTARDVARTLEPIVATLVELEGRMEVSEYLESAFARERVANEAQVSRAIAQATGLTANEERTASEARRRIGPVALIAGLAIVVLGSGAIAFVVVTSEAPAPALEPAPARAEIAAPAPPSEPAPAMIEPAATDEVVVEPPPQRPAKRASMSETGRRLPMWEWQR